MDYTLTRIDLTVRTTVTLQKQEIVTDPLEQEVNKSVYMGKLEHALHDMVNWGRKNSIWPYNFGLSCCYVEMVTSFTAVHDVARFGAEVLRASASGGSDGGRGNLLFTKMAPVIQRLYDQMLEPKWVIPWAPAPTQAGCTTSIPSSRAWINSFRSMYIPPPAASGGSYAGADAAAGVHCKERRPLMGGWRSGVYRANMQSERERKRGERIAVTNLRTPDEI